MHTTDSYKCPILVSFFLDGNHMKMEFIRILVFIG